MLLAELVRFLLILLFGLLLTPIGSGLTTILIILVVHFELINSKH